MSHLTIVEIAGFVTALVAAVADIRTRRIPNYLTFGSAAAAVVYHGVTGGGSGLMLSGAGWAVGLIAFLAPFVLGGMGAGDVKLLAALGAWIGPMPAVWVALYTGVAGGCLALMVAIAHGYLGRALANIRLLLTHWRVCGIRPLHEVSLQGSAGPRLAYAVPIFVGLMVTLWLR